MPLDPSIALSYRPIQVADPLAQYGQISSIQNAQNQNALAQFQLSSAQRQEASQNALSEAYKSAFNPETGKINELSLIKGLAERGAGHMIPDVQTKLLAAQKEQGLVKKTALETEGLDFKQRVDKANKAISDIAALSSPQEAITSIDVHLAKGDIDQQKANMLKAQIARAPSFVDWQKGMLVNILDAKDRLTMTAPKISRQEAGGVIVNIQDNPLLAGYGKPVQGMANIAKTATPGELMTNARERERMINAENPNVVAKQVIGEDGTVTNFNKFGQVIGTVKGAGKQSATYAKTEAQKKTLAADSKLVISELTNAVKEGGLIDQSTGSGAGRLVDIGAGFFGKATEGDIAIGRLQPIADIVLKTVPRFEGPQSDKDTASYKEAAGNLANANLPREKRKAAANEIIRLMQKRQGQFITSDMASGNTATPVGVAPPEGFVPD
jgi:hypothetical protein